MEINSSMAAGLHGFQQASERVSQSAQNIASAPVQVQQRLQAEPAQEVQVPQRSEASIDTELINMTVARQQAEASVKVIESADERLGLLIDTKV